MVCCWFRRNIVVDVGLPRMTPPAHTNSFCLVSRLDCFNLKYTKLGELISTQAEWHRVAQLSDTKITTYESALELVSEAALLNFGEHFSSTHFYPHCPNSDMDLTFGWRPHCFLLSLL